MRMRITQAFNSCGICFRQSVLTVLGVSRNCQDMLSLDPRGMLGHGIPLQFQNLSSSLAPMKPLDSLGSSSHASMVRYDHGTHPFVVGGSACPSARVWCVQIVSAWFYTHLQHLKHTLDAKKSLHMQNRLHLEHRWTRLDLLSRTVTRSVCGLPSSS